MTAPTVRVLIADDHPVYRDGLARTLSELGPFEVVGVAANGLEAVRLARELVPDVIVMDLRMPELDGIEATRRISAEHPEIGIVVLTMFEEDDLVQAAIRAGARGYLLKDADDEQIAGVVAGIARGEVVFGPRTANRVLDLLSTAGPSGGTVFPQLTAREHEVLDLVARGMNNTDIAQSLFLSERTVRNYVSTIISKLHLASRSEVIAAARDAGVGEGAAHDDH